MGLTLNELAKVELAKRNAERTAIEQIYKEKGDVMMENCKTLIKDIILTLNTIFNDKNQFIVNKVIVKINDFVIDDKNLNININDKIKDVISNKINININKIEVSYG